MNFARYIAIFGLLHNVYVPFVGAVIVFFYLFFSIWRDDKIFCVKNMNYSDTRCSIMFFSDSAAPPPC